MGITMINGFFEMMKRFENRKLLWKSCRRRYGDSKKRIEVFDGPND